MSESLTMRKQVEQFRDRWTSTAVASGLEKLSDRLGVQALREIDLFKDYDDSFLERISTDIAIGEWQEGSVLFEEGSYIDLAFFILEGEVDISLENLTEPEAKKKAADDSMILGPDMETADAAPSATMRLDLNTMASRTMALSRNEIAMLSTMDFDLPKSTSVTLGPGEVFGEIGALSGWPQSVTARAAKHCKLVQIRLPALRRMKLKSARFKERLDRVYRERTLLTQLRTTPLFSKCGERFLRFLSDSVELVSCKPDEEIVAWGANVEALYMVRSGFVKLTQPFEAGEMVVSYLSKGQTFGDLELLMDGITTWQSSAHSVEYAELVQIPRSVFQEALEQFPPVEEQLWRNAAERIKEAGYSKKNLAHSGFVSLALDSGLVQGSSMLVIDLEHCTRCDDCVRACAATHEGRPRFVREGKKLDNLLIARSCYHCRDPVCLVGCPTGAIGRAGMEDVIAISDEICIGCGTCSRNCPYDAIVMHETGEIWPNDMVPADLRGRDRRVASKCDQCAPLGHEPACVANCPQGCATRVGNPEAIYQLMKRDPDA